ncbi:zinc finger CCCH domain-containing protein 39 [Lactuca sativa]|uniref:C3H1-type domain-containing protein n=1 Tax=Lactuca sativa TaxID=4236 RepID=A0A9R1VUK3_LACSA|nr:zinc finger CCCH domain-containing protein 39 [Lactuca sativa]KAJ0212780.1 hypothetical protein LSAT_V11C400198490 [Lactuca sativa]
MFQNENQFPKRLRTSEPMPNRRTQYKTELCLRFQRGTCDYADRCCFAHGYGHLSGFDKWQELTALDGASRIKYLDENQNPKCSDRSRLCWRVMNGDKCQFGDKCHFNHIKTERESAVISVLNVAGRSEMQQQKKTPWRTKLCNRWMSTGSCPYGFKCCFAHGESELRKQRSNDVQAYAENAPCDKKIDGKQREFKWKNVEKIGRVYADWITDTPLVHVVTGNLAS